MSTYIYFYFKNNTDIKTGSAGCWQARMDKNRSFALKILLVNV